MAKIKWIKTPDDRREYLSVDGKWMVSFGMGHPAGPDFPRIWTLHERTGKYVKGEGEILRVTLGHHATAKIAMKAAEWTEEEQVAAYRDEQAKVLAIVQAKYAAK